MNRGNTLIVVLVLLVVAAVAGGAFFFLRNGYDLGQGNGMDDSREIVVDDSVVETPEIAIEENANTLVANLVDVSGGSSTGMGYVLRDGVLSHKVVATLPGPTGGDFYEGWLVDQATTEFFSTGDLLVNPEGKFVLDFIGDNVDPRYNFVVITLETVKDDTPEAHILEGLAK